MTKKEQLGHSNAYTVEFENGVKILVSYDTVVAMFVPTCYKGKRYNDNYQDRLFLLPEYDHSNTTRQHVRKFYKEQAHGYFKYAVGPSIIIGAEITTAGLRINRMIGWYGKAEWDVSNIENGNYEIRF